MNHDSHYRALSSRDQRFDGRFFVAVKTTQIYCRPICPARTPKSENVLFYPTAAAAQQAGFRPCLRCRPEAAPDSGAWLGVSNSGASNTVSRALALIESGSLDETHVNALAERLGLGERQLRRLFAQHLGASPLAVAQTRRVLLAQQLLYETRLPISEVAYAAGFSSIRRFNHVMSELFQRPPTALRRQAKADLSDEASGGVRLLLRYRPPYDWQAVLAHFQANLIPGVEWVGKGCYCRNICLDGLQGTISVEPEQANALQVKIRFPRLRALSSIIARLRRMFDLAADLEAIHSQLKTDPMLATLIDRRPGLRVPGAWDGFEVAVKAVLGQQMAHAEVLQRVAKLVADYGEPSDIQPDLPGLSHHFPKPERLLVADFAALSISEASAASLKSLSKRMIAEPRLLETRASLQVAIGKLCEVPGLGDGAAQLIAIRQLREPDAFPSDDPTLRKAIARQQAVSASEVDLVSISEAWRPWRAYAAQHLWASMEDDAALADQSKSII